MHVLSILMDLKWLLVFNESENSHEENYSTVSMSHDAFSRTNFSFRSKLLYLDGNKWLCRWLLWCGLHHHLYSDAVVVVCIVKHGYPVCCDIDFFVSPFR